MLRRRDARLPGLHTHTHTFLPRLLLLSRLSLYLMMPVIPALRLYIRDETHTSKAVDLLFDIIIKALSYSLSKKMPFDASRQPMSKNKTLSAKFAKSQIILIKCRTRCARLCESFCARRRRRPSVTHLSVTTAQGGCNHQGTSRRLRDL